MRVLLIIDEPISLDDAPSSRIYHIGRVLNEFGIETIILPNNKKIFRLLAGKNRLMKYLRRVYLFFYMFFIIKKEKINTIFARGKYICIEAITLAKLFGIKTIFDFHGYVYEEEVHRGQRNKANLTKLLENLCLRNSDIVVTQTERNKSIVKKLNKNVLVLENGVDLKEFDRLSYSKNILKHYSIPSNKPIIGFVGNWENWMNIEDLLNASRYFNKATFVIIGEGISFTNYRNEFKNVCFTGKIPHKHAISILMSFEICVSPLSKDKMMKFRSARKTLEYMAAGKPIIVSNVIGKEDFLKEGINCLFYEPENPKDLENKINLLLTNDGLKDKMGKENKELAKIFSWEKTIERSGLIKELPH